MRKKSLIILVLAVLLTAALGVMTFAGLTVGGKTVFKPVTETLSLGLDLRGGVYTIYLADQADYSNEEFGALLDGTAEVIRARLTSQGYTEANVSLQGSDSIRVEIPNVTDPQQVLDLLGTPAHLTFTDQYGNVIMEGKDIEEVGPAYSEQDAMYVVSFKLNDEGTKKFADGTRKNVGKPISIVLDGQEISSPTVNEAITGGRGSITLGRNLTRQESYDAALELSTLIMSGALPLDIEESETRAISATLGENAMDKALIAGIIGVCAIFLFMAIVYRMPGLMADIALADYIILIFLLLSLLKIQLTLPGIAGILLGIGMAVDANVVIFERFREEIDAGRGYESAVKSGFKNALRAIIDANITTLIAAFVLMYFGTGSIKGFSYTLCLGVLVSMFTAVFVTRFLLKHAVRLGFVSRGMYTRSSTKREKLPAFTEKKSLLWGIPALLAAAALVMNLCGAGLNPGIDFTGGSLLEYSVGEDFATEEITGVLKQGGYTDTQVSKVAASDGSLTNVQIRVKLTDSTETTDSCISEAAGKYQLTLNSKRELTSALAEEYSLDAGLAGGRVYTFAGTADGDALKDEIETALENARVSVSSLHVYELDDDAEEKRVRVVIKADDASSQLRSLLETELKDKYPELTYVSLEHAGAVSSARLVKNALMSLAVALVLMLVYIIFRFDLYSGLAALIALAHDCLIMLAFMSFFGFSFQLNSSFIAALLTIVGYSINNTIIVFDRVRENKKRFAGVKEFEEIAKLSVRETLARTLNTTTTTLLTLLALYIFGVASIREFTFPLLVGMFAGTYSSVLLACPTWAWLLSRKKAVKA